MNAVHAGSFVGIAVGSSPGSVVNMREWIFTVDQFPNRSCHRACRRTRQRKGHADRKGIFDVAVQQPPNDSADNSK